MIKSKNGRVTATGKYPVILTDIAYALDAVVITVAKATNKTYKEVLEDSISALYKLLPIRKEKNNDKN